MSICRLSTSPKGPLIDVIVGVSSHHAAALQVAGHDVPTPVRLIGLIDTGASRSVVDPTLLAPLHLTPSGLIEVRTPSTGASTHACPEYDVSITLAAGLQPFWSTSAIPVLESHLPFNEVNALVGRDILSRGTLICDGPSESLILGF